nr:hypothetical protein [Tanacetum cinerariifolium]
SSSSSSSSNSTLLLPTNFHLLLHLTAGEEQGTRKDPKARSTHRFPKWSLDELAYGVPSDGLYQTNPPSPNDIISTIRIDR